MSSNNQQRMCYQLRNWKTLKKVRHAEIGPKTSKELRPKGKQPQVLIPRADPYNVLRLFYSDEDSDTKSLSKSDTSKDFVSTPDIRASDVSDNESGVPVTDLKIDLEDGDVAEKHLVTNQDGELPTSDVDTLDETQIPTEEILQVEPSTSMVDTDVENTDIVAVADVHRDVYEPPRKVMKTVKKRTKPNIY